VFFNNGHETKAKAGEQKTLTVTLLKDGKIVKPEGLIEVVMIGPRGPSRPLACTLNPFGLVVVPFYAEDDGNHKLNVYYDDVLVQEEIEYPLAGIRKPKEEAILTECADRDFRIPLGTEDETDQQRRARIELENQRRNEQEDLRQRELLAKEISPRSSTTSTPSSQPISNVTPAAPPPASSAQTTSPRKLTDGPGATKMGDVVPLEPLPAKRKNPGDLFVEVHYPDKQLLVDMKTTVEVSLLDLPTNRYCDEPGSKIEVRIDGPNGEVYVVEAERQDVGKYHIIWAPRALGKHKAMVFFNNQKMQHKFTKIKCVTKIQKNKIGLKNPLDLMKAKEKKNSDSSSSSGGPLSPKSPK
jgi:hypothetical protein